MPNTYCLLVGINKYSNARHNLRGCVNDLNSLREYLELSFNKDTLHIETLKNELATKDNIIEGFKRFRKAKDGDICIFYFSGHGSTWEAPEFLYHISPDKLLTSLVCHDSREPDKIDLMDKELAYLIWEATHQKEIQFIAITDCCHSGEVTRDEDGANSEVYKTRELKKGTSNFSSQSFYVTKKKSKKEVLSENFQIKRGRHIHLAACRRDQKAIEGEVQNICRGVFTYHLVDTLKRAAGKISYKELIDKVNIKILGNHSNQSPQLFVIEDSHSKHNFLSNSFDTGNVLCQVYYKKDYGWVVNCGLLNSLITESSSAESLVKILKRQTTFRIDKVYATYSTLHDSEALDSKQIYNSHLILHNSKKLKIGLSNIPFLLSNNLLDQYNSEEHPLSFRLSPDIENVDFLLKYQEEPGYYLTNKASDISLFKRNKGFVTDKVSDLFIALEKVCKWKHLLGLENSKSSINHKDFKVNFFRITEQGDRSGITKKELVKDIKLIQLKHELSKGRWLDPGFQFNVTNTSHQPLWVSLLYLSDDYFITNRLLPKQLLNPNETAWAVDRNKSGDLFKTINVKLSDQLYQEGETSTIEHIKLLVSTKEFDTNYFNQASVASNEDFKELIDKENNIKSADWDSLTISLKIIHS